MTTSIKVSVIIPVYNSAKYLKQCLNSVLKQTLYDIEVICVDDGSTDKSLQILNDYAKKDVRVTVLTQENINAGAARNKGLAIAKGTYLAFLDSDDYFELDMLEKCYDVLEKDKSDVVIFSAKQLDMKTNTVKAMPWSLDVNNCPSHSPFSPKEMNRYIFNSFKNWPWNKVFRRKMIQDNSLLFQEIPRTNDMAFVCLALVLASKISIINQAFTTYRTGTGTSLQSTNHKAPLSFWDAYKETKARLIKENLYEQYEQSFLNTVMTGTIYNLNSVKSRDAHDRICSLLLNEAEDEFNFSAQPIEYYYDKNAYKQYMRIIHGNSSIETVSGDYINNINPKSVFGEEAYMTCSDTPKVSVIMPSLNVKDYIRECIESVLSQTLTDIEVICVDAGSTDGTFEILQEYAEKDGRVRLIYSEKKSYGIQMNMGLDVARGKYIGIVETDDYIQPNMYESLYEIAENNQLDFVKADFYRFAHVNGELKLDYNRLSRNRKYYGTVLNPQENVDLFNLIMNTWSGIYNRKFLQDNHIRHNETPGASYQDNGFWFKTFAYAQRVYFVNQPFYMNRRDNPNSSVHSKSKVYCMNEEYAYILKFLNDNPDLKERFLPICCYKKYHNYVFTYNRIGEEFKLGYIIRFSEEFQEDYAAGNLHRELFGERNWKNVMLIIQDPIEYYLGNSQYKLHKDRYRLAGEAERMVRKIYKGIDCCKEHGCLYTIKYFGQKVARCLKK